MIQFTYYDDNDRSKNIYIPEINTVVNFDEDTDLIELFVELWRLARYAGYQPNRNTIKELVEALEYRNLIEKESNLVTINEEEE